MTDALVRDCPICVSAGTVIGTRCQVCDAEFGAEADEAPPPVATAPQGGAADLPPVAPPTIRLSDVVDELRRLTMSLARAQDPRALVEACGRVERMVETLRAQFLRDVVTGFPTSRPEREAAAGSSA